MNEFEKRLDLSELQEQITRLEAQMASHILGQNELITQLLIALFGRGHVLIEGVPGVAKTMAAKALARCIGADFSRIQFTPDLMPSDVLGTTIYNQKTQDFELRKGPIYSNLVLIDEINRAPAKTQAALFEVMEEYQVSVDGHSIALQEPFMVLATQNPIEHEGTYRLPEAQLDRFMMKIHVGYPDESAEMNILAMHQHATGKDPLSDIETILSGAQLLDVRKLIRQVEAKPELLGYISAIIRGSRQFNGIFIGASPRAGVALLNASKALAAMNGRDFITPEDVKYCALPVLRHRILLSPEKEMEGIQPDELILSLLNQVEVPR
ncbi:MAG TPA: magnesium chelatase [Bacteroidetes bacterium]|nr:magnesium chelatase [Bacteroidota bacterium]